MELPKPKHCEQNWLEMKPTNGGRICRECSKTIVDFSKMKWVDIENIQQQNNNSVCGMYSQKQLDNWGREVPANNCLKFTAATSLFVSLSLISSGQSIALKNSTVHTIIKGTITGTTPQVIIDTLPYANISLKGAKYGTVADSRGQYQLDITDYLDTIKEPKIIFSTIGFKSAALLLKNINTGEIIYNPKLEHGEVIYFSVGKPTVKQRIKSKFRRLFSKTH